MKIINLILGLGTAIIVGFLIYLGIQTFYPEPKYPLYDYNTTSYVKCAPNDQNCFDQVDLQQKEHQTELESQMKAYQDQSDAYGRNFFIIANIVGLLVFIGGFLLLFVSSMASRSVPIGIMLAGIAAIINGYMRGWGGTDDKIKFAVGLIIAIVVIGGSMWLMQKYHRRDAQPGK